MNRLLTVHLARQCFDGEFGFVQPEIMRVHEFERMFAKLDQLDCLAIAGRRYTDGALIVISFKTMRSETKSGMGLNPFTPAKTIVPPGRT